MHKYIYLFILVRMFLQVISFFHLNIFSLQISFAVLLNVYFSILFWQQLVCNVMFTFDVFVRHFCGYFIQCNILFDRILERIAISLEKAQNL